MNTLNGPRKSATGPQREPEYWCLHCDNPRWRAGGASELGRHQAVHGGAEVFPDVQWIDTDGFQLDWEGQRIKIDRQPVPATATVTGWVRSRALIVAAPLKHTEASR